MTIRKRAAVLGASGYTGGELLRYLSAHPSIDVVWATADRNAGRNVGAVFGHLRSDLVLQQTDPATVPGADVAFLALPHGQAASTGRTLAASGLRVVDLSADWRLHDPASYDAWYGWSHPAPDELDGWIYGLTELHRDEIAGATRVANPGCYPSAAILALAPALRAGVVEPRGVIVDAASGVSGAGRKVEAAYLFSELDASYAAYGVGKHRHTPEMEQELGCAVTFTPHLAPMTRGILATCYAPLGGTLDELRDVMITAYKDEPFVRVVDGQPSTKQVWGCNHAMIGVAADVRTGTAVITCAIDNLGKGAAGQAIQNANLMLGLDETAGLQAVGVYP